ncbi:MAG: hypothetical protein K940chlam8_00379 [Chlamydiae bacterium]|nr:hypothetical protein [Chlamydiota bacterium]
MHIIFKLLTTKEIIYTLLLLAGIFIGQTSLRLALKRARNKHPAFKSLISSLSWAAFGIGFVLIWLQPNPTVILSLFAFLAALTISSKEWLMNLSGYFLRLYKMHFGLQDRIEVNGIQGIVAEIGFLTTTMQELNQGHLTGKTITFPNRWILDYAIKNESIFGTFTFEKLCVQLSVDEDWEKAKEHLISIIKEKSESFLEQAKRMQREEQKETGHELINLDPKVWIDLKSRNEMMLLARFIVPVHLRELHKQTILESFLQAFYAKRAMSLT